MTELDATCTFLRVANASGRNGLPAEHLRQLRDEVLAEPRPIQEMADALDVVREATPMLDQDPNDVLRQSGQFLIGISVDGSMVDEELDGLLFAQGEELRDSGAFSVVRMATWVRQKARHSGMPDREISRDLVLLGLEDVAGDEYEQDAPWGVPVEQTTRIIPLYPSDSERPEGYLYAHRADFEAIEGLTLPNELRRVFANVAAGWYEDELMDDSSVLAAVLQAGFDSWKLPTLPLDK